MSKIQELREKRANVWEKAKVFLDEHRGENGLISPEDNVTYEKMEEEVVSLGKEVERLERQEMMDRELSAAVSARTPDASLRASKRSGAIINVPTNVASSAKPRIA